MDRTSGGGISRYARNEHDRCARHEDGRHQVGRTGKFDDRALPGEPAEKLGEYGRPDDGRETGHARHRTLQFPLRRRRHLGRSDAAQARVQVSIMREGGSGTPVPDLSIEVDDVDATLEQAIAMGFPIEYGPADEDWGVRRFFVRDPFGRLVNILTHKN